MRSLGELARIFLPAAIAGLGSGRAVGSVLTRIPLVAAAAKKALEAAAKARK